MTQRHDHDTRTAADLFGDGAAPATTRDRLIDTAMDLFFEHGFHAVGVDRVIAEVGVTKTTFYNHFESKDELILAVIRRRDRWEIRNFTDALRAGSDDPRARLMGVFDLIHRRFTAPEYRGCIFLNAASEFPSPNDPVRRAAMDHTAAFRAVILDAARLAGAGDDADALTDELMVLVQGTVALRHVAQDDRAALAAARTARRVIDAHLPPADTD